ncbi:MAG: 30S ribosomal protein S3 [Abditibacteriota bacterium]|nr:30S ribosomal protein S3 [Abditibacteriota bacterium]
MGQKVNPIGLRIGVNRDWDSKWYANDKDFAKKLLEDVKIRKTLKKQLYEDAVSSVEIERPAGNKVRVTINAAKAGHIIGRGGEGIERVRKTVEKLCADKTQVSINVVEIVTPETNAQLVAESIAQQIEKRISPKRAMKQSVKRAMFAGAKGIKVRCAGRLSGAEMARIEKENDGKVPLHTLRADIDYGFAEAWTQYGHIGVKVWIYKGDVLPGHRRKLQEANPRKNKKFGAHKGGVRRRNPNNSRGNKRNVDA